LGENAGEGTTTGINNVFIGNNAGTTNSTQSGNIFIGNNAGPSTISSNELFIHNGSADKDNALIYGDFSGDGTVNLNGSLSFNKGTANKITMPGNRGSGSDLVLTIDPSSGSTNWEDAQNLITIPSIPPEYIPPTIHVNKKGDFLFKDEDNYGTLIELTNSSDLNFVKITLPRIESNMDRILKIKNDQDTDSAYVFPYNENDFIEGGYSVTTPLKLAAGETYTLQAGIDEKNTWFIIDYTNENLERTLLKTITTNYEFDKDPEGPRVATLVFGNESGGLTAELPPASENPNRILVVKNSGKSGDGNTIRRNVATSDLIDNSNSYQLTGPYRAVTLQSDGVNTWYILSVY
jgi:hypothetical protein